MDCRYENVKIPSIYLKISRKPKQRAKNNLLHERLFAQTEEPGYGKPKPKPKPKLGVRTSHPPRPNSHTEQTDRTSLSFPPQVETASNFARGETEQREERAKTTHKRDETTAIDNISSRIAMRRVFDN
jgi:hypothetical protein